MLGNIIVLSIVFVIVVAAIFKIVIDKKNGVKCSGCPSSNTCPSKTSCPSESSQLSK